MGVAGNVYPWLGDQPAAAPPTAYVPLAQDWLPGDTNFVLRTRGAAAAVLPEARKAVAALDPQMPIVEPETLRQRYRKVLAQPRFRGWRSDPDGAGGAGGSLGAGAAGDAHRSGAGAAMRVADYGR